MAQQEFAEARQYYHDSGLETRKRMQANMQALVELDDRMRGDFMRVLKVRFCREHCDDEGTPTISLRAVYDWIAYTDRGVGTPTPESPA